MPRRIQFKKQHKPIGFGDAYDFRSVEGHQNAMIQRVETRRFNRLVIPTCLKSDSPWGIPNRSDF
jgi:hypothetical protein